MKKIQVNVAVSDPEYGRAIVRGMSAKPGRLQFRQLQTEFGEDVADDDSSVVTCEGVRKADLWITDQEAVYESYSPYCLYLSKDEKQDAGVPLNRNGLLSGLNQLWFQKTGKPAEYLFLQQAAVTAFFGVSGGSGITACALAVARLLYRIYGVKCLYISMNPVDDSGSYLKKGDSCGLLRLLYALQRGKHEPIQPYLNEEDGIWYFRGTESGLDEHVRVESMEPLFAELARQGNFQHVIIDFGTSLTEEHIEMMQCCSAAVLVGKGERALRTLFQKNLENKLLNLLPNAVMLHNMEDGRQDVIPWEEYSGPELGSEEKEEKDENRKERKTYRLEDCREENRQQEKGKKKKTGLPEFHVSVCEKAFIHMGGRWKIDLSGCFGAELSRLAVWIEEGDGRVSGEVGHEENKHEGGKAEEVCGRGLSACSGQSDE
ncbi:MAG: hypothetical protein ACI4W2_05105 [Eubacterium sp.]